MDWNVSIGTRSPDDGDTLAQQDFDRLNRILIPLGVFGSVDDDGWDIQITVKADSAQEAFRVAFDRVLEAAHSVNFPTWEVVEYHVVDAELDAIRNALR